MHRFKALPVVTLSIMLLTVSAAMAGTGQQTENCHGRIIVKFREGGKNVAQLNKRQITRLQTADKGSSVTPRRLLSNGAHLIQRSKNTGQQTDAEYIQQLNKDPDIEYAECDARRRIHFVPDDPDFPDQWHLSPDDAGGINAEQAWDTSLTQSINPTVIAVIDTGILPHVDLVAERILPGYDFISEDEPNDFFTANDGNGRDNDPSDPGDYVTQTEIDNNDLTDCEVANSSWHGTAITGIIAAELDNTVGIAGIDHNSDILPVRALGKCGGFTSDIADAIRWAAGGSVNGVPGNPDPAAVINLSFGSIADCSVTEQQAIDAAVAAGALVVVAAGNEGTNIDNLAPANCENVLVITATTQQGGETCYTNIGTRADIAAPGGNSNDGAPGCSVAMGDTITSISNDGTTIPGNDAYGFYVGTSFSTPMVSAAIGLIRGIDTNLTNTEIESLLISTARAFPQGTTDSFGDCDAERCGAGILDLRAAVELAPAVDITPDGFSFNSQTNIALNAVATSNDITVSGINVLSPISISGGEYSINNGSYTTAAGWIASGDTANLRVTAAGTGSTSRTAALNIGGVSANFTVTTQASNPPSLGGGDGGGGSVNLLLPGYFFFLLCVRSCYLRKTLKKRSSSHL